MNSTTLKDISSCIHDLIKGYVYTKAQTKSGIKWEDFKDKKITDPETQKTRIDIPKRYKEVREKLCMDAFYRLRACKNREDFMLFFTGTLCSVPQYLSMQDYQLVAAHLIQEDDWLEIKSLAMLALSKLSYV